jgi:hypothetical protein
LLDFAKGIWQNKSGFTIKYGPGVLGMYKTTIFILLCAMGILLESGCVSSRMVTDLKPATNAELKSPAGTFYVADLKFILMLDNPSPQVYEMYQDYQRKLLPLLKQECVARYPGLFAKDASSSTLLSVTAETATTHYKLETLCWMFATLTISSIILPCPGQMDEHLTLKINTYPGRGSLQEAILQKTFRREIHTWVSLLTPLALIDVPGESDFPKVSLSAFDMQKGEEIYLQQLASQLATGLAETIAAKDPDFWRSQPFTGSSSMSPARPISPPVALPLPTDSAAPF